MGRPRLRPPHEELRIGGIFSLTGYLSWSGRHKRKAAELKVDMINEAGGVQGRPLKLISFDDQSLPAQASRIAEDLVFRHRVAAMVGTGTLPISRAVARIANRYRTPAFINSGYAIDPVNDLFVFNTAHKTEFAIACSFQYFAERGIDRLALLMPEGPLGDLGHWLGKRLAERVGIRIVGEERFDVSDARVGPQLQRLRSLRPFAFFSFVTGQPAASVAETMAAMGLNQPLLVSHGNANPRFLKLVSHSCVPIIVPSGKTMAQDTIAEDDPCRKVVLDFNERHLKRFGEPANYYSAELADAIDLIAEGFRQSGDGDSERLREAVENVRDFRGMQGSYNLSPIDHYGTGIEQIVLLLVHNGLCHIEKAFSSIDLFEDFHGSDKGRLIRKVTELLPAALPGVKEPVHPDEVADSKRLLAAQTGLSCTDLGPDVFSSAKLFCQQKLDMMKHIRSRDFHRAKMALSRVLTVTVLQHFERPEAMGLAVLELFLALFDVALDEGAQVESILRLRHRLIEQWLEAKDPEALCLWIIRATDDMAECMCGATKDRAAHLEERVTRFVRAHLSEELTVEQIARELGLSQSRLMHLMRSECNTSLGACVTRARMEAAMRLLRSSDMPVGTIALEVGYKDQGYFTRVFRKNLKETPQTYRKRILTAPQPGRLDMIRPN